MKKLLAVLILAAPALAQEKADPVKSEYDGKLRGMRISIDYNNAALEDVISYMREVSGMNLFVSNKAKEKGELRVSLKVQDLPMRSVLNLMLKPHGLTYIYKEGVLYITTTEDAMTDVVMEIYDVRDLLYPIQHFPGAEMSLGDQLGAVMATDDAAADQEMPIVDIVKAHTGGKTWEENPKAAINMQNGLLVVKQTKEVHKQIQRLMGQLRIFK